MSNIIYCNECAHPNPAGSKFCSQCGQPIHVVSAFPQEQGTKAPPVEESVSTIEVNAPKVISPIACPRCGKDDMVQKITSIVQGETVRTEGSSTTSDYSSLSGSERAYNSSGSYRGRGEISGSISTSSSTSISATQRSTLAQRLLLPSAPSEPKMIPDSDFGTKFGGLMLLGIPIGIYIWIRSISAYNTSYNANYKSVDFLTYICVPIILAVGAVVIGAYALAYVWEALDYNEEKKRKIYVENEFALRDYNEKEYPRWQREMERWNKAYYCRRDDVVYIPGESNVVTPNRMGELLKLPDSRLRDHISETPSKRSTSNTLTHVGRGEVTRVDSKDAVTYNNRGLIYLAKGDYDLAIADFTVAISLDPKNADAYYNRGNSYDAKGKYNEAIADYETVLRLNPNHRDAADNRQRALAAKKNQGR